MAVLEQKTIYLPTNTGGLMVQVDDATVADNIFVFADGIRRFKWVPNSRGEYHISQAKVLSGNISDNTTILQAVFNNSFVQSVVLDAQQVVTINGSLNCNGKKLIFTQGSRLTGTGTVTNFYFNADPHQWIFGTSLNITPLGFNGDKFSVQWFGAVADGVTDSTLSIQKAIDAVIYNSFIPRTVFFPKAITENGLYLTTAPLICAKKLNNFYNQCSICLEGEIGGFANQEIYNSRIYCMHTNSFAIGIQLGYSCVIKGLVIQGRFTPPLVNTTAFCFYTQTQFFNSSPVVCRNNRYSPFSGVVIDPFTKNGTYPESNISNCFQGNDAYGQSIASYYAYNTNPSNMGNGGSTALLIEDCNVTGFVVSYLISPNGQSAQAEDIVMDRVQASYCMVAWAYCQSQTRGCAIKNWRAWFNIWTCFDNCTYGDLTGELPASYGGNIAGAVYRIFNMNGFQSGIFFNNLYAENLVKIGIVNGYQGTPKPSTFNDCQINFVDSGGSGIPFPDTFGFLGNVIFRGGYLKKLSDFESKIYFQGYNIRFEDCYVPYLKVNDPPQSFQLDHRITIVGETVSLTTSASNYSKLEIGGRYMRAVYNTEAASGYTQLDYNVPFKNCQQAINLISATSIVGNAQTFTINSGYRSGEWTMPGDIVIAYYVPSGSPNEAKWADTVTSAYSGPNNSIQAYTVYGLVTSANATTINVANIPFNLQTADNVTGFVIVSPITMGTPFIGDCIDNNATITNVEILLNSEYPSVGQFVYNPPYRAFPNFGVQHDYSRIVAVNQGAKTVTLSDPNVGGNGRQFITGNPKVTNFLEQGLFDDYLFLKGGISVMASYAQNAGEVVSPGRNNPAGAQHKVSAKSSPITIQFKPGDAGFPIIGATTYNLGLFYASNGIMVYRDGVLLTNGNQGGGDPYFTYVNGLLTFSTALISGEVVQISLT